MHRSVSRRLVPAIRQCARKSMHISFGTRLVPTVRHEQLPGRPQADEAPSRFCRAQRYRPGFFRGLRRHCPNHLVVPEILRQPIRPRINSFSNSGASNTRGLIPQQCPCSVRRIDSQFAMQLQTDVVLRQENMNNSVMVGRFMSFQTCILGRSETRQRRDPGNMTNPGFGRTKLFAFTRRPAVIPHDCRAYRC